MPTGKVRFYDEEKGFGFITGDDGQDVFLHATALPAGAPAPKQGTRLEFGVAEASAAFRPSPSASSRLPSVSPSVLASPPTTWRSSSKTS